MSRVWSWRQAIWESELAATTKIVLQALASHLNDMGDAMFPSQARLARMCSLSERAVIAHLHIAEQSGWIAPRKRDLKGSKWAANEYVATWPDGVNDVQVWGEPRSPHGVNDVHTNTPSLTSREKRERARSLEAFLKDNSTDAWFTWSMGTLHWTPQRCRTVFDTFRDYWRAKAGKDALKADWEATWRNWCRREGSFEKPKPLQKGEIRVKEVTPEQSAQEKHEAKMRLEFFRLSGLPENNRKSEQEIWAMVTT